MIFIISSMIAAMINPHPCPRVWGDIDSLHGIISSSIGL